MNFYETYLTPEIPTYASIWALMLIICKLNLIESETNMKFNLMTLDTAVQKRLSQKK